MVEFAGLIEPVARTLWGEPNDKLSNGREMRFGNHGARLIRLDKGTWADNEEAHPDINSGGVVDLIRRETGCDKAGAFQWLIDQGLADDDRQKSKGSGRSRKAEEPPPNMGEPPPSEGRRIVKTYDYTDASGTVIYQVVRYEPKTFTQRRPAPGEPGVWVWGLGSGEYMRRAPGKDWYRFDRKRWETLGKSRERMTLDIEIQHGLYRIVELRERGVDDITWLPEGEKDVDALIDIGLFATTNSGGAANWTSDVAKSFADADVVILVDNDEPGRKRGEKVAASLRGVARRVRVLDLSKFWKDIPQKGDVFDWIKSGGTAKQLEEFASKVEDWRPAPFASKFGAMWFRDLDTSKGSDHDWLIDDLLTVGECSLMYGASQSGKSFLAIDAAMSIARGTPFFGHKVRRGGVVYQAGEGQRGILNRFKAFRRHYGVPSNEDVPLAVLRSPVDLYHADGDTDGLIEEIKALAGQMTVPLALVVIDTLATATAGADENSAKDMTAVLAHIARISKECACHVMLVHHKNASGERPRGHTSIFANINNAIEVTLHEKTGIRTAINAKQKDGEKAAPFRFKLMAIEIGRRADDKRITSCVCLPVGEKEAAKAEGNAEGFKLNNTEALFFRALLDALAEHGVAPPASLEIPAETVVDYARVKERFRALVPSDDDDAKKYAGSLKKQLQGGREALTRYRIIGIDAPYVWWTGKPVRGFPRQLKKVVDEAPPTEPAAFEPPPDEVPAYDEVSA